MTTVSLQAAILSLVTGIVLGLAYFGGLWWTSRKVAAMKMPGVFFAGSFVVRIAGLVAAMFWVTGLRLVETSVCVLGMLSGRYVVVRLVSRTRDA